VRKTAGKHGVVANHVLRHARRSGASEVSVALRPILQNYQNTLQLVDKSLALINGLLASNVFGNVADIIQFLFREHIVSQWSSSQLHNFDFSKIKKRFRGPIS
jgi:hypothetical protein